MQLSLILFLHEVSGKRVSKRRLNNEVCISVSQCPPGRKSSLENTALQVVFAHYLPEVCARTSSLETEIVFKPLHREDLSSNKSFCFSRSCLYKPKISFFTLPQLYTCLSSFWYPLNSVLGSCCFSSNHFCC